MNHPLTQLRRRIALAAALAVGVIALLVTYQEPIRRGLMSRAGSGELLRAAQRSPGDRLLTRVAAERLLQDGRARDARELLSAPAAEHPQDPEVQVLLARACLDAEDPAAAGQALNRVLETRPEHAEARYWMAEILYRQGFADNARDLFEEVTRLQPRHGGAWERSGELRLQADHFAEALRCLEQAERLAPTARGARLRGAALRSLGRDREAEHAVREALERDPRDSLAHYALADLLQGRPEPAALAEARAHLETSVRLQPTPDNLKLLGLVCRRQADYRPGILSFRRMVELAPASAEAYLLLGQCYQAAGRKDLADHTLAIYRRLEPLEKRVSRAVYRVNVSRGEPAAQVALARTYLEVGRQDLARATLVKLRRRDPKNPALPELERRAAGEPALRIPPLPPDADAAAS